MKKINNYTFQLGCIYIMILALLAVSSFDLVINHYDKKTYNKKRVSEVVLIAKNEPMKAEKNEEESISIIEEVEKPTPKQVTENVDMTTISNANILATETVNVSHYGHDCYGCRTGYTASGYYVGDGRIYYQDNEFGNVRIVAADRKYPLGTILRIGYRDSTIVAIVLDRGSGIGDNKKYQIDLLTYDERTSSDLGIITNTGLEVLRLGY